MSGLEAVTRRRTMASVSSPQVWGNDKGWGCLHVRCALSRHATAARIGETARPTEVRYRSTFCHTLAKGVGALRSGVFREAAVKDGFGRVSPIWATEAWQRVLSASLALIATFGSVAAFPGLQWWG